MGFETIRLDREDGVAILTLNRPDKLNSFTAAMHREMCTAFGSIERDKEARALLMTGAGRAFSAGQDLSEEAVRPNASTPPDFEGLLRDRYNTVIEALRALPMPTVAAVNGVAAGAGVSLALATDIALAARSARFALAFAKIGLVPDSGATYFLPRLIGGARARGLALTGETLTGEQAESWGLIWKCVDDEKLMAEAMALARSLAQGPTRALVLTRRAFDAAEGNSLAEQLALETRLQTEAAAGEDYAEGVAAFIEKRAPRFRGR